MNWLSPALRPPSVAQPSRLRVTAAARRKQTHLTKRLMHALAEDFQFACRRHHVTPTRFVLVVSVPNQTACLFEKAGRHDSANPTPRLSLDSLLLGTRCGQVKFLSVLRVPAFGSQGIHKRAVDRRDGLEQTRRSVEPTWSGLRRASLDPLVVDHLAGSRYHLVRRCRCSTSRFGVGQDANSNCTPLGLHRVAEKIGGGWPVGTVFRSRNVIGFTWRGLARAPIAHRILWLDGLEPGFNRGGRVDTHQRYIYIHGLGDEPTLGRPASRGCIHLAAQDLLPLFDLLPAGTLVWITRQPVVDEGPRHGCDSI